QARILAGAGGRGVRGRDALGDDPGSVVPAVGPARVPHVATPSSFRADRLGGVARGAALLHHRRPAGAALALHLQAAMTIDARHPLPGSRPLVVGAARSGIAAARLLAGHGLDVRVCDRRAPAELEEAAGAL